MDIGLVIWQVIAEKRDRQPMDGRAQYRNGDRTTALPEAPPGTPTLLGH